MPSSIGSALGSVGSALGGLFGGGGAAGVPAQAAEAAASALPTTAPSLPPSWDPSQPAPGIGWGTSTGVGAPASTTGIDPTSLASGLASAYLDPTNAAAINAGAGGTTAAAPTDWMTTIGNWLKGDVTGAKGAFGTPIQALGTAGSIMEAINRWQLQQTLQNPAALTKGAAGLYQPMSKALKRSIIAPVTAQAQETGQINAPGLYSQSVASALAPYQYQMQMQALRDYMTALAESGGAYPQGGLYGPGGPSYQGGSSSAYGTVA